MSAANRGVNVGPPRFKIAVHSIVWLAKSGGLLSSAIIANQVQSHATFMRRVMQTLALAGIVESRGGREGGYLLAKPAGEITLKEVYCAVRSGPEAADDSECGEEGEKLDAELEKILHEAELRTVEYLGQFTIEQVMRRADIFER